MISGYDKPLYILPFDHRHSYLKNLFHWQEPLAAEQTAEVAASKRPRSRRANRSSIRDSRQQ